MTIQAFAALAPKSPLQPFAYDPRALGPHDIELAVSHCGLCHSDIHLIDDDWKRSVFPLVPGHEVVGIVTAIGDGVTHLRVGQRAGVGWQRSACLQCPSCRDGHENLCTAQEATCVGHHGGLAERLRTDARFAFAIPEALPSEAAAPLLCGGVTVFAPLTRFGAARGRTVGVIGVGGLGHLAVRFSHALGAATIAFTSSPDKRDALTRLGADEVARSTDARDIRRYAGQLDLLVATANARLDWITYLQALRPGGVLCLVGTPPGLLQIPPALLVAQQRAIAGSDIGDRATIAAMLEFAAAHAVTPVVETAPLGRVNDAIARVRDNRARYRMVIEC